MRKSVPIQLALLGLLSAGVVIATTVFRFPVPNSNLYGFNLGEAVIYIIALLFGGWPAAIVGGIGSALSDVIGGYPVWAPITFVIKGSEGFVVGYISKRSGFKKDFLAVFCGAVIMVIGYSISAGILYGIGAVPVEFIGDVLQTAIGGLIAIPIARSLRKTLKDHYSYF